MSLSEIYRLSAGQLARSIRKSELSPVEIVKSHLSRIEAVEPTLNSFITLLADQAIDAARQAEREILGGRYRGPLHGIPVALKDLFYTRGIRTTGGSKIFDTFVPNFDATVAERLREAGAILLGKLNMHPFAYGVTGENPDYGPMHNPWNAELVAGGSSGGSGSAVAAGESPLAMGSDTGGSVRIPGALCGVVGFKPTYGRLSRYGLMPLAWSQDHPGPLARTVEDCALVMNALAGFDPKDPFSSSCPVPDFLKALTGRIKEVRIGVPKEYDDLPLDPQVKELVWRALHRLGDLGASVSEVSWPMIHDSPSIAGTIQMSEATAYYSDLLKTRGPEIASSVRLRLEAGFFIPAVDYIQAQRARTLFCQQSLRLLEKVDLLAGPTVPVTAFRIGTKSVKAGEREAGVLSLLTQYVRPFNLNGFPAITLPCGFSDQNLPVGLQLSGRPFEEELVLRVAHAYEQSTEWHLKQPPVALSPCKKRPLMEDKNSE